MTVALGILSTAHLHAASYAAAVADLDGVEIAGVADDDERRGEGFAATHDLEYVSRDALLDAVDGALVCSTNADRGEWVRPAADRGVDVLAEKPLATTADEAANLAAYCDDAGVALSVAMPLRHSVPASEGKAQLDSGAVGDLRHVSGTNRGHMPGGWFTDPDAAGGGAVMDHTVHVVDLVHWLTGERVAEVYAETGTRFHDLPVEDVNLLSMELTDGTAFSLDGSWSRPEEYHTWGDATLELVGTEGVVAVDCFGQSYTRTRDAGDDAGIESVFWGTNPDRAMVERFVGTVRDGRPPATPGADGADAVAVVEAAYASAERGVAVAVEYP